MAFRKLKTAIQYRIPLYKLIDLVVTLWDALRDKKIDKKEQEKLIRKIVKLIKSVIDIKGD